MDLIQLKQIWQKNGFRPNKRLGQNFLIDKNIRDKLLNVLEATQDKTIVEIGAGFGVMSFSLADRCKKLFAVEKDDRVAQIMAPLFSERENITFIQNDILKTDLSSLVEEGEQLTVYGNIPYYISTPIIEKMINERQYIDNAYIVIQEEVVDRIVSPPGSKKYGSLSCFVQFYTRPEKLFKIKRNSFYPKPEVTSALLKLAVLSEPSVKVKDKDFMFKIVRKAFSQRRKKAINPLSDGAFEPIDRDRWIEIFKNCQIDPSSRAEGLSLSDYARLSDETSKFL